MKLLPQVKHLEMNEGYFSLIDAGGIFISQNTEQLVNAAGILQEDIFELTGINVSIEVGHSNADRGIFLLHENDDGEQYSLQVKKDRIEICGRSSAAVSRAIQTLLQIIAQHGSQIPCLQIRDFPDFIHRGFYHDVTRGKVPEVFTLKTLIRKLAYYKINELQLYIEHTFAFKDIPELWSGKDPLTSDEILELDRYCKQFHIDLIPSLASFGHLYELLRLKKYEHLNELDVNASAIPHNLWDRMAHYTINPSNPASFELIRSMIEEYLPLFSSRYFNICCDETFDLGKGKNKDRVLTEGTGPIYVEFVKKIIDLVKEHGKVPMLWGDIILKHPELIQSLPQDVIYLNWGYNADIKEDSTRIFSQAGVKQYVCPGTQGWSRFAYDINAASSNIHKMVEYGKRYGADGVLNTDWGDCGHINLFSGLFHGMILGAALSWNTDSYKDDNAFDAAVSVLEWNSDETTLYGLLRELGELSFYHFGNLYAWVSGTTGLWDKEEVVKQSDPDLLETNYQRALQIRLALIRMRESCPSKQLEYDELIFGASGTAWILGVLLFKKRYEYHQNFTLEITKEELIRFGYCCLNEIVRLWRIRNKESELNEVIDIMRGALEKIQNIR